MITDWDGLGGGAVSVEHLGIRKDQMENAMTVDHKELARLFEALAWADECGLKYEFMEFFLEEISRGYTISESIQYANREWDL